VVLVETRRRGQVEVEIRGRRRVGGGIAERGLGRAGLFVGGFVARRFRGHGREVIGGDWLASPRVGPNSTPPGRGAQGRLAWIDSSCPVRPRRAVRTHVPG